MKRGQQQKGFTIVELLIVIVVIAILAAITVVAYNGIQNRAYVTSVVTDLKAISTKAEMYAGRNGTFPVSTNLFVGDYSVKIGNTNAYLTGSSSLTFNVNYCTPADNMTYAVTAVAKDGTRLYIRSGSGVQQYTGGVDWLGSDIAAICGSVLSGATNSGNTGYRSGGSQAGWRDWTTGLAA